MYKNIVFNINDSFKVVDIFVKENDLINDNVNFFLLENDLFYIDCYFCFLGFVKKIMVSKGDDVKNKSMLMLVDLQNVDEFSNLNINYNFDIFKKGIVKDNFKFSKKIFLPDVGFDNSEIVDILVKEGSLVKDNDVFMVIENSKVSVEIPSVFSGVVNNIFVHVGDVISAGCLLLTLYIDNINSFYLSRNNDQKKVNFQKGISYENQDLLIKDVNDLQKNNVVINFSPSVRKLADLFSVNLNFVKGTGLKNKILRCDVINYIKNIILKYSDKDLKNNYGSIFKENEDNFSYISVNKVKEKNIFNLCKSWSNIPHVTQFSEVDISNLNKLREDMNLKLSNESKKIKLTLLVFLVKILSRVLLEIPIFNSFLSDNKKKIIIRKAVNIGVVINTDLGLFVPVLYNVEKKGFIELSEELNFIKIMVRSGKYNACNFKNSSFTISNLGGYVEGCFTPIINNSEVAILGVSKSYVKPIWNFKLSIFEPKLYLPLSLSYDHRVINGVESAKFINLFIYYLSNIFNLLF